MNGKRNGNGREYYSDGNLFFEGQYLYNFKRKGKEYINGKLDFEGEYIINKKYNGIGYDRNGNNLYELKNGNGFIKEYDRDNNLKYEGEYLNGKRNGIGKEYYYNGKLRFEGVFLNGEMIKGKLIKDFY